ncbi:hypothetical protein ACLBX9_16020 [Methylobacterium sp. A49B]
MPLITETAIAIGAAVYGQLSDSEKAELAQGIRDARRADEVYRSHTFVELDVSDDWYAIMMQNECSPRGLDKRKRRVTKVDLMLTLVDMAAAMPTADIDWGRMLNVWQDRQNHVHVTHLFEAAAARVTAARPALLRRVREAHVQAEGGRI